MRMMDVSKLKPHPKNNYFFDDIEGEPWTAFLESVETSGVIEPVIVDGADLTIVSGHQRVRACKKLGIKQVAVEERHYDSEDERLKQLIETNIRQRGVGNTNAVKFGRCVAELERIYGIRNGRDRKSEIRSANGTTDKQKTQDNLAEEIGVSKDVLKRAKKLAELPEELQQMVMDGKVTASTASRVIARLSPEEQQQLAESISGKEKVSGKEVEKYIAELKAKDAKIRELQFERDSLDSANRNLARQVNQGSKTVEKVVEIEVIPDDYEEAKKKAQMFEADNKRLVAESQSKAKELVDAKEQIRKLQSPNSDEALANSAKDGLDHFSIATYDFIRRYGGNVWAFDKWDNIPQETRVNFTKAVQALSAFAQQMTANIEGLE